MNDNERKYLNGLAEQVIGAAFEVSNVLGAGFLEKGYQDALLHELRQRGLNAASEQVLKVRYKDIVVGDYLADLLVEGRLIVELKCVRALVDEHLAQCLNYLRATDTHLALLINFQKPRVEIKRVVHNF